MAEASEIFEQCQKRLAKERKKNFRKRQNAHNIKHSEITHHDLERIYQLCFHCDAKFWLQEKDHKSSRIFSIFIMCCSNEKIYLPSLLKPLLYLLNLYTLTASDTILFRKNIRAYNNILACISLDANIDKNFQKPDVSNFQIHGQVYHQIGPLLPEEDYSFYLCSTLYL